MSYIELHKTKGVNAHMTYCPRCKGEASELILVGADDGIYECNAPSSAGGPHKMAGRPRPRMQQAHCPECGYDVSWTRVGTLEDGVRLPATQPCDTCQKEMKEHEAVVEAGGVYFRCNDCKAQGVIKASAPFAMLAREAAQHQEEEHRKKNGSSLVAGWYTTAHHNRGNDLVFMPCGIEFNKKECPACGPNKVADTTTSPT